MSEPENRIVADGNAFRFLDRHPVAPLIDGRVNLQEWFASDSSTLKDTRKITARTIGVDGKRYFVKRYRPPNAILGLLGEDRGLSVYRHSITLEQAGVPVAKPLAYIRQGSQLATVASYLVSESLEDMTDLRYLSDTEEFEQLRTNEDFFASIARCLSRLHGLGYSHGDMKWANIMVHSGTHEFRLVDLDGLRRPLRSSVFIKDLSRFILNAREKRLPAAVIDNFVACYAHERGLDVASLQPRIEAIYEKLLGRHRAKYGVDI